ncbi:helix-turn-helix domain-containing protein [Vibrio sp. SCSIO 43135]|uniref:AraC family transcriptional regulator n=1 Tax=Vibrio sp. SCSIO 43135 TaxID=2819096 RepID=UPI0020753EDA|nr:helix-turn-helix domain-containing protein [Vibrio sp. SCSIO 43135]USD43830.1 helix-turn-helix domain-containing protein [Vibrio sp. SCSIO 43135]
MLNAKYEKVPQRLGASWRYMLDENCSSQSEWHYHTEYELVLHRHYQGVGNVGHYQGEIEHNTLWLIPPNTPHRFNHESSGKEGKITRHLIWFKKEWLSNMMYHCVELRKLEELLRKAEMGLGFSSHTAEQVCNRAESMSEGRTAIEYLSMLLEIFSVIASDNQTKSLLSFTHRPSNGEHIEGVDRVNKLIQFIDANYASPLSMHDVASELYMSESSVHRLFESHFQESFSQYLKKLRLNRASDLLIHSRLSITVIAEKVGYRNQANFNRLFKEYKGVTPSQYRKDLGSVYKKKGC